MSETELKTIRHYRRLSSRLATAGQPEAEQYPLLAQHFDCVINLARSDSPHALADESRLAADLKLEYIAIPVDFKQPSRADFEHFCRAMAGHTGQRLFVHCALNWRVSCFVYLYRVLYEGMNTAVARHDLDAVWQPDPTWQQFIDMTLQQGLRHEQS